MSCSKKNLHQHLVPTSRRRRRGKKKTKRWWLQHDVIASAETIFKCPPTPLTNTTKVPSSQECMVRRPKISTFGSGTLCGARRGVVAMVWEPWRGLRLRRLWLRRRQRGMGPNFLSLVAAEVVARGKTPPPPTHVRYSSYGSDRLDTLGTRRSNRRRRHSFTLEIRRNAEHMCTEKFASTIFLEHQ